VSAENKKNTIAEPGTLNAGGLRVKSVTVGWGFDPFKKKKKIQVGTREEKKLTKRKRKKTKERGGSPGKTRQLR